MRFYRYWPIIYVLCVFIVFMTGAIIHNLITLILCIVALFGLVGVDGWLHKKRKSHPNYDPLDDI